MLDSSPFSRNTGSKTWQVRLLMVGEPLRATSLIGVRGTEIAVFDTGLPQHANSFINGLKHFGLVPDDVTLVFNTHAHIDHSHNNSLFRNARIFCSRLDREWTQAFHETLAALENPRPNDVLAFYPEAENKIFSEKIARKTFAIEKLVWAPERWGRAGQTLWIEDNSLPAGITTLPTPGHVPHHLSYIIETDEQPVLLTGDALVVQDEENAEIMLVPPHNLANYKASQRLIASFAGIIAPGHDRPFENRPIRTKFSKTISK